VVEIVMQSDSSGDASILSFSGKRQMIVIFNLLMLLVHEAENVDSQA
jgi:hypothetical protein